MDNSNLMDYLSDHIDIDYILLDELFGKNTDAFNVAHALIAYHKINKTELGKIWGNYLGFAYVNPNSTIVNLEYIEKLGTEFIKKNNVLPMYKFGKAVTVSTSYPQNPYIQDKIEKKLDEIVSLVFCFPFDIDEYLRKNNIK